MGNNFFPVIPDVEEHPGVYCAIECTLGLVMGQNLGAEEQLPVLADPL